MLLLHLLHKDFLKFEGYHLKNVDQEEEEGGGGGVRSQVFDDPNLAMDTEDSYQTTTTVYDAVNGTFPENCSSPIDNIHFEEPHIIGSLVPLGLVCLVVILGNMMVIFAVFNTHKLRGATYLFIVSLACADLMLGLVILPFSAMYEVFDLWIFGSIWCSIWLAVDVWMCTASILHLVVISLDRYIAVTHPITYPNLMTSKRAKMLIAGAWVLSFVICFPPLVGWNDQKQLAVTEQIVAEGPDPMKLILERCKPQCVLNQEPGYVIYSAVGSFYAPMLVMMFFNWRIYRTAKKTTIAIRQGWTKVKGVGGNDDEMGMGIHRGGSHASSTRKSNTMVTSNGMVGTKISTGSSRSSSLLPNGANVTIVCKGGQNLGNGKMTGIRSPTSKTMANSNGSKPAMPRSASCLTVNKDDSKLKPPERTSNLTVGDKNLLSPNGSKRGRSKSVALVSRTAGGNFLTVPNSFEGTAEKEIQEEEASDAPAPLLRLSHHQPCPNHVAGKTFSERGTQTLIKQKSETSDAGGSDEQTKKKSKSKLRNCLAIRYISKPRDEETSSGNEDTVKPLRMTSNDKDQVRNGRMSSFQATWQRSHSGEEDLASVGSGGGQPSSSGKSSNCFQCHPRRWRRKTPKFCAFFTFKKCRKRSSRRRHSSSLGGGSARVKIDTPSLLNMSLPGSTDELRNLGGVAAMIGSVVNHTAQLAVAAGAGASNNSKQNTNKTFGRRNIKNQVRRFRMETKAAKTLGIIVGCFILCWFPFFTMYLVTAFCEDCIPSLMFSIIFWLGYCNSAINPFIYAMFSREFRGAFKKILCRVFCRKNNDQPNRRGVFMAFQGAAAAAAVVTAAGARNTSVAPNKPSAVHNSEVHSGFHSNNSHDQSRRESVLN